MLCKFCDFKEKNKKKNNIFIWRAQLCLRWPTKTKQHSDSLNTLQSQHSKSGLDWKTHQSIKQQS